MSKVEAILQFLCRHNWRTTRFQALVPGVGQKCSKCGKQRRLYTLVPREPSL